MKIILIHFCFNVIFSISGSQSQNRYSCYRRLISYIVGVLHLLSSLDSRVVFYWDQAVLVGWVGWVF